MGMFQKLTRFKAKSLTAMRSSIFTLNPSSKEAQKLKAWYASLHLSLLFFLFFFLLAVLIVHCRRWNKNQLSANFEALR